MRLSNWLECLEFRGILRVHIYTLDIHHMCVTWTIAFGLVSSNVNFIVNCVCEAADLR